ncbi:MULTISPECIES: glutamyl-tRNA amidotransferase [Capnocytophaga]|uniref:Glutamyl-tRNA amidotransferase n=1 Tax=Capnocytophaga genosp. AHN8471 TaxID=327574 RepID=A0ABS1YX93_9FLAO|nr:MULTISPECIES: glutamyl-tRNA amidotransferase [Capnocytophaga]MBM0651038.1 glutamyl-tRNA amidotransferase [Capnocytophaga genosp. AHN8471]MBM0661580.1 glutamyl-tRNA amidotransferase [Capnocytophaga genosp. AHN8471]
MSTTVVTKVVSYQVGVDILGFPVYHEHLFTEEHITHNNTKKQGKNMTKHHRTHTVVPRIFAYIVKQF